MEKMEVLTFSNEQLDLIVSGDEDDGETTTQPFYKGVPFTDRRLKSSERSLFNDANVVHEGVVDEAQITYKEVTPNVLEEVKSMF